MRAEDGFWGAIIIILKNVALAARTSLGCSAFLSKWTLDNTGNVITIPMRAELGVAALLKLTGPSLPLWILISVDLFLILFTNLSLSLSGTFSVSLVYNSVVARSAHCSILLIGERATRKTGSKFTDMLRQTGAPWKVWGENVWPCPADGRMKRTGTFFRSGRVVPLLLCVFMWGSGRLGCETRPIICLDSLGWEQANWRGRDEQTLYQDLIYFPKQFSVFTRLRKCGGSKITVINWNSECASMALIIRRSSISLMSM